MSAIACSLTTILLSAKIPLSSYFQCKNGKLVLVKPAIFRLACQSFISSAAPRALFVQTIFGSHFLSLHLSVSPVCSPFVLCVTTANHPVRVRPFGFLTESNFHARHKFSPDDPQRANERTNQHTAALIDPLFFHENSSLSLGRAAPRPARDPLVAVALASEVETRDRESICHLATIKKRAATNSCDLERQFKLILCPNFRQRLDVAWPAMLLGRLTFRDRCCRNGEGGRQPDRRTERGRTAQFASLIGGVNGSEVRLNRHFEVNKGCLLPINNK